MTAKAEQPLPDEWVTVFDDMLLSQQRAEAERDALRADRLKAQELYAAMLAELNTLRAENERLRAQNKILEARLDQILVLANLE